MNKTSLVHCLTSAGEPDLLFTLPFFLCFLLTLGGHINHASMAGDLIMKLRVWKVYFSEGGFDLV